jgi:hypothetical protein
MATVFMVVDSCFVLALPCHDCASMEQKDNNITEIRMELSCLTGEQLSIPLNGTTAVGSRNSLFSRNMLSGLIPPQVDKSSG